MPIRPSSFSLRGAGPLDPIREDPIALPEDTRMARRRGGGGRRSAKGGKTTINKTFTPAFTLKGGYGKRRTGGGKSRY